MFLTIVLKLIIQKTRMKMMSKGKRESKGVKKLPKAKLLEMANNDYNNPFGPEGAMTIIAKEIERTSDETNP